MSTIPIFEDATQEALRNSEHRYRRLFETAQDGILILDGNTGKITDANPFLLKMLGYLLEEILGSQLWEIGFFKDRALSEAAFERLREEGYIRYDDLPLETKKGRRHDVEFVSNLYEVDHQTVIQCNIRDISERKVLEAKLRQAQKLDAIGQLAGGIAHDYNNILTSTLLQLSVLLDDISLSEPTKHSLRMLQTEANRAASLTRQLLLFSRIPIVGRKPIDLNEILGNLLEMLRRLLSKHVSVDLTVGPSQLWIEADRMMVEQVVINLCLNGQDAMVPNGGRLKIHSCLVEIDQRVSLSNPEARIGRFACLEVTDGGCGMGSDTLSHIFEPFYTTKDVGKGTGLGLSTVYGIAKQHNGWVDVSSEIGAGSTFRVYFPALSAAPSAEGKIADTKMRGGHETILLVEDERPVRDMIALALRSKGYHVLEAASGPEAIELWNKDASAIDLLFADMRMPQGMTGTQLYERFKASKPTLKGVISSGYSVAHAKAQGLTDSGLCFLPKPYDISLLATTVRNSLDRSLPNSAPPNPAPRSPLSR